MLAGADDGVGELAHAAERADDGRALVLAVVNPDVIVGTVLRTCGKAR